jgi:hypothetical protein
MAKTTTTASVSQVSGRTNLPDVSTGQKLQMLELLVQASPAIVSDDARDTFLTLIWLVLADLGVPSALGKAA